MDRTRRGTFQTGFQCGRLWYTASLGIVQHYWHHNFANFYQLFHSKDFFKSKLSPPNKGPLKMHSQSVYSNKESQNKNQFTCTNIDRRFVQSVKPWILTIDFPHLILITNKRFRTVIVHIWPDLILTPLVIRIMRKSMQITSYDQANDQHN